MDFLDHPVLYSDNYFNDEWQKILDNASDRDYYVRKRARRKMRRIVKELLRGIKPRIFFNFD